MPFAWIGTTTLPVFESTATECAVTLSVVIVWTTEPFFEMIARRGVGTPFTVFKEAAAYKSPCQQNRPLGRSL